YHCRRVWSLCQKIADSDYRKIDFLTLMCAVLAKLKPYRSRWAFLVLCVPLAFFATKTRPRKKQGLTRAKRKRGKRAGNSAGRGSAWPHGGAPDADGA